MRNSKSVQQFHPSSEKAISRRKIHPCNRSSPERHTTYPSRHKQVYSNGLSIQKLARMRGWIYRYSRKPQVFGVRGCLTLSRTSRKPQIQLQTSRSLSHGGIRKKVSGPASAWGDILAGRRKKHYSISQSQTQGVRNGLGISNGSKNRRRCNVLLRVSQIQKQVRRVTGSNSSFIRS